MRLFILVPLLVLVLELLIVRCQITSWSIGSSDIPLTRSNWVTGYHKPTDTVWMLGGWSSAGYGNAVISYHFANDTFIEHSNLTSISSLESDSQSFTVINDILYFNTNGTLGIFDMSAETETFPWPAESTKHTLPTYAKSACLANDGRYLFFSGGEASDADALNVLQIFDTYDETWITGPLMDKGRLRTACIAMNSVLYVFGGQNRHDAQGITFLYFHCLYNAFFNRIFINYRYIL